jgi:hypothetical protein
MLSVQRNNRYIAQRGQLFMPFYIVYYVLYNKANVLKKFWCQLPEDGETKAPEHVGST